MSERIIYSMYHACSPIDPAADSLVQSCRKDASYHESVFSRELLLTCISRFAILTFLLLIAVGVPVSAAGNAGQGDPCGPERDACTNETVTDPFAVIDTKLKPADAAALKSRIQDSLHAFSNNEATGTWYARNAANRITFSYTGDGTGEFTGPDTAFGLSLNGIGRDATLVPVTSGVVRASGRQLEIARPGYTEWYRNNDNGVEQGLTITGRPTGTGPVQVRFLLSGNLTLTSLDSRTLAVSDVAGNPLFEYTGLHAFDADGRDLPASIATDGHTLSWVVDDTGAVYPITIDPVVVSASAVTARFTGGAAEDWFGYAVALSSDGSTALVGAYRNDTVGGNAGAAYILEKPSGGWSSTSASDATARFTGGAGADYFGYAVALSPDGSTALVGAYRNDTAGSNAGAAYIFEKGRGWTSTSASGATARFTGGADGDLFGNSVALSSDGSTALVGAYYNGTAGPNAGAAYIFEKGREWTSMSASGATARFTGGADNDFFGYAVTLSSDGSTALVGAYYNDTAGTDAGAAYVFEKGRGWTSLSASGANTQFTGGADSDYFGNSVALSSDGSTALVGAYNNDTAGSNAGAAYILPPNYVILTAGGTRTGNTGTVVNGLTLNPTGTLTNVDLYLGTTASTPAGSAIKSGILSLPASTATAISGVDLTGKTAGAYYILVYNTSTTNLLGATGSAVYTVSPAPTQSSSQSSTGDTSPTPAQSQKVSTISVNVGQIGRTPITKVDVTGTNVQDIIVTATEVKGPGTNVAPAPGTVYEYVEISPARFTDITGSKISFAVPQSWLDANHLTPKDVVLYHNSGKNWEALSTNLETSTDGQVYYTAIGTSFSRFAICGQFNSSVQDPARPGSVQTSGDLDPASGPATLTFATPTVNPTPVVARTTAVPAPQPAPGLPVTTLAIIGAAGVLLIGGVIIFQRWWIRRQNPALFKKYQ